MAMGAIYLTDTSSGAPALSGTNGTLCNVLDWALVQKGWAVEYTASNARVYRPGAGNRLRLFVHHDSAVSSDARLAVIRGCENASGAAVANLTNPFPTVAQLAANSSGVCVSTVASSTARQYRIIVTDRFLLMFISCGGNNNTNWDFFMFGDAAGAESGDPWATLIHVGNSTSAANPALRAMANSITTGFYSGGKTYFARSIDGAVLSSNAVLWGSSSYSSPSPPCSTYNAPAMRAGYANRIDRSKVGVTCMGSSGAASALGGTAMSRRAWVPHLWNPEHSGIGGVTSDDTHTDSAYAAGSSFVIAPSSAASCFILETSDTWSPPSG